MAVSTEVLASTYSVVGDDATDNATALISMRDAILGDNTKHYRIVFNDGGIYQYTNNRWLRGIRSFELIGNGATFKPVGLKTWARDTKPLLIHLPFEDYGDTDFPNPPNAYVSGYKFNTASRGDPKITCTTVAEATNMTVGRWCVIFGFLHQYSGFPANFRFFEFKKVTAVDGVTGDVTFDTELRYDYDADWFDKVEANSTSGAPRILPFDGGNNVVPEFARLENCTFLANPDDSRTGAESVAIYGLKVELENVTAPKMTIAISDYTLIKGGRFDNIEADKVVCRGVIDSAQCMGSIAAATGLHEIEIRNCLVEGSIEVSPINKLVIANNIIKDNAGTGHIRGHVGGTTTNIVYCKSNLLYGDPGTIQCISNISFSTLSFDEVDGNGNLILNDTESNFDDIRKLQVGTVLINKTSPNKSGHVNNISFDGTNHVIAGSWNDVQDTDDLVFSSTNKLIEIQTQFNDRLMRQDSEYVWNTKNSILNRLEVPVSGNVFYSIYGFIEQITFTVKKAYNGSERSPTMNVRQRIAGSTAQTWMRINLKNIGTRILSPDYSSSIIGAPQVPIGSVESESPAIRGQFPGDTINTAGIEDFTEQLLFVGQSITGSENQMPEYEIKIKIDRFHIGDIMT